MNGKATHARSQSRANRAHIVSRWMRRSCFATSAIFLWVFSLAPAASALASGHSPPPV